ncbi:putative transposase [Thermodesulfitimonas autotrophica]|uniref:Putative transposase n=1 Tax=Thermodesulfitimonas autotrophica TaxID=1894989 RepID=A0A3N5AW85_9THEO|nr:transposase [Thermodesulfitimonas autotrophica]RPF49476.1 putative transposase [Thermodesulfitimonas autotrophica]
MRPRASKPIDMMTVPGRIYPDAAAREELVSFMGRFQAAKRSAYQALRRGKETGEIVKTLYEKFFPNARWCQWAVEDAKAAIESQKELVKMYVSDLEAKIEKSEEKLDRTKDRLHCQGILARLNKLRTKLAYWQGFLERNEVPPAVFGGKKNLLLLQEGKLSKEEWREMRSNAFYSVGQANMKGLEGQHGNANTEIVYHDLTDTFYLNVYIPPEPENKTGRRRKEEEWVTVPLEIPARYRNLLILRLLKGEAYTVRVVRKDGRFECLISFPLGDTVPVDKDSIMAGIDLNPEVAAVTVVSPNGNFKASRCFWCPELVHVSHEKREWLAGNLAKEIANWLEGLGVKQVALEELAFARDHDTNRYFNRITHNFCKKLLFNRIVVALRKRGVAVFTVSARFTSLIGYFKYAETYGLSAHQAAALVIARRALGYAEKMPRELMEVLSPKEGWRHFRLWGKFFGLFKAARKRAVREGYLTQRWRPEDWLVFMFGKTG